MDSLFPARSKKIRESDRQYVAVLRETVKAPCPGGIPAEFLKEVARACQYLLLNMYNCCFSSGVFNMRWKEQRLMLIS